MVLLIVLAFTFMMAYQMYLIKKYKNLNKDEMSYVAGLTHDLKNPANAQINMLNLLLKGQFGQLTPKQYEMLKLTCSSAKYMSNLVSTALAGYKYTSETMLLNKTDFDIIKLINSALKNNEYLINEKDLKIIMHAPASLIISGDKLQIERVIMNLIQNAITYSFNRSDIIIRATGTGNYITFSISNKSNYIKPHELKNIFNKFAKTINSKYNKTSTGLGLYTAKRIIQTHGGQIYAESVPEGICTFGFRLNYDKKANKVVNK